MIDYREIKSLAVKHQTNELNIIRQYLQNLFLKWFYQQENSENFLFKGGTALKIAYQSPRFSEDLDFSGIKNGTNYEKILLSVMESIEKEGIKYNLEESKSTSGGWLSILSFQIFNQNISIRNEVSFRKKNLGAENRLISSEIIPAYRLVLLAPKLMIKEKFQAAVSRQKSRDFFDIYFILRDEELRRYINIDESERKKLKKILKDKDGDVIKKDIEYLLPVSFHPIIKDLPERLMNELGGN